MTTEAKQRASSLRLTQNTLALLASVLSAVACTETRPRPAPGTDAPNEARSGTLDPDASPLPSTSEPASPLSAAIEALPPPARWRSHLLEDIMPFWTSPDAVGAPLGNFPTFRCHDGTAFDRTHPCPEVANADGWISSHLDETYVRMQSRQTYAYGVAYHLTGDARFLAYMKAGVDRIRDVALERANGSIVSRFGPAGPLDRVLERTAQDLAYAVLGLALYYNLTRDPVVLEDILRVEQHLMSAYWDGENGMLRWVVEDGGVSSEGVRERERQELVAQLDQLNGYMLMLYPTLPIEIKPAFAMDIRRIIDAVEQFWAPELDLYHGALHTPESRALGSRHTDFGHTIKACWMVARASMLLGDPAKAAEAMARARRVLERAFVAHGGRWGVKVSADGRIEADGMEWWSFAELDQVSALLGLAGLDAETHLERLARTYARWLEDMVDHQNHGVWNWVGLDGQPSLPKAHTWKNGYHETEHVLIAYETTAALRREPLTLYFALDEDRLDASVAPYALDAEEISREIEPLPELPGHRRVRVTFDRVRFGATPSAPN